VLRERVWQVPVRTGCRRVRAPTASIALLEAGCILEGRGEGGGEGRGNRMVEGASRVCGDVS